ncbi:MULTISPECIES: DNA phosphorothioation-associated protein 4 [Cyanophyceae]|uniref:DNA phosphorothioation-associated protein 4 n=1 Tax=Cyanophyceae TaxID=3028117 RepID=UPI001687D26E|nr:DNA phosphorothioation-associated protein 4 [Trichocoleus sp. FACHB-40]MBD2001818.1 DNA phosphorothioation-associated protein 4 [Trichocoleus sp. FACHB-40]
MATNRIKVAKDKADLVKALVASDDTTGAFQTYVEVIAFAAALGAKHKKRVPLGEPSKKELSPIPQEHFISIGHDIVIKLLAVNETEDIKILSSKNEEHEDKRTHIFEEYANGGLEILQNELRGAVDYSERILLFLSSERMKKEQLVEEFDITKFLS